MNAKDIVRFHFFSLWFVLLFWGRKELILFFLL